VYDAGLQFQDVRLELAKEEAAAGGNLNNPKDAIGSVLQFLVTGLDLEEQQ
jgi:hypothetical protein